VREGVYGWCSIQDCNWRPRSFLIVIHNRLSKEDYMKTLFHEMQHILQHIRGDLRDKRGIRCWKGIDCSDLEYSQQEWEIEANQKEQEIYKEYLTEHL
jgi:Zn-dependent peptidase ImmA (M78 family)